MFAIIIRFLHLCFTT